MKRLIVALLVGGAVFGAVFGVAASLGGITSTSLGADSAAVTSCDTDGVSVEWGTHVTDHGDAVHPNGGFVVASLTVKNISGACENKYVLASVTVGGPPGNHKQFCISGAIPVSGSVTMNGVSQGFGADCLNAVTVWADEVTDIHLAIKDTPY